MKINLSQFKRFEKQIILKKIGLAGQKKIFSAKIFQKNYCNGDPIISLAYGHKPESKVYYY